MRRTENRHVIFARPRLAVMAFVCAVAAVRVASGQSDTAQATRRVLLDQAAQASQSGDHTRALDLATRAGAVQMTPSLRMFIAEEQRATGDVAAALGSADLCVREAERDNALRDRQTVLTQCRALATAMRSQVGYVTVHAPVPRPANLQVSVGDATISDALLGVPYVVTPGTVTVLASAPGMRPFHSDVTVAARATVDVNVPVEPVETTATPPPRVEAIVQAPSPAPAPLPQPPIAGPAPRVASVRPVVVAETPSLAPPGAALSVGVAGIVAGAVLWVVGSGTPSGCRRVDAFHLTCVGADAINAGNTSVAEANASAGAFVAGGVIAIAGAVWLAVRLRAPRGPAITASLALNGGTPGIVFGGRF